MSTSPPFSFQADQSLIFKALLLALGFDGTVVVGPGNDPVAAAGTNHLPGCSCSSTNKGRNLVVFINGAETLYSQFTSIMHSLHEKPVLKGYRWLAENYQDGDRIFLFGHSLQEANEVRRLADMINMDGIVYKNSVRYIDYFLRTWEADSSSTPKTVKDTPGQICACYYICSRVFKSELELASMAKSGPHIKYQTTFWRSLISWARLGYTARAPGGGGPRATSIVRLLHRPHEHRVLAALYSADALVAFLAAATACIAAPFCASTSKRSWRKMCGREPASMDTREGLRATCARDPHLEELAVRGGHYAGWARMLRRPRGLRQVEVCGTVVLSFCAALWGQGFIPALSVLVISGVDLTARRRCGTSALSGRARAWGNVMRKVVLVGWEVDDNNVRRLQESVPGGGQAAGSVGIWF
ncbi:hypothetical protein FA95DRAFT_1576499 [Auriscalpium vulgare]|uniref:Uncharacterized protein n=1 Tax=Auriscalpium vulgare TaxID=40419 RepID=A0ACB8RB68_9AGAM|nr:hypothetical protein FA95DRAFT_1576499 [Auriscalpium vulgare]